MYFLARLFYYIFCISYIFNIQFIILSYIVNKFLRNEELIMFIYNLKLNGDKISKTILGILIVTISLLIIYVCFTLVSKSTFKTNDSLKKCELYELNSSNYTNVLKNVHDNLDLYVGQNIKFTGFVYRLYDFSEDQFVLGRNMIISSDYKAVVVGFLCSSPEIKNYSDNEWIEIEGTITKGNYHGEIPVIKITKINKASNPSEEYVYPPDDNFVTTSTVL